MICLRDVFLCLIACVRPGLICFCVYVLVGAVSLSALLLSPLLFFAMHFFPIAAVNGSTRTAVAIRAPRSPHNMCWVPSPDSMQRALMLRFRRNRSGHNCVPLGPGRARGLDITPLGSNGCLHPALPLAARQTSTPRTPRRPVPQEQEATRAPPRRPAPPPGQRGGPCLS